MQSVASYLVRKALALGEFQFKKYLEKLGWERLGSGCYKTCYGKKGVPYILKFGGLRDGVPDTVGIPDELAAKVIASDWTEDDFIAMAQERTTPYGVIPWNQRRHMETNKQGGRSRTFRKKLREFNCAKGITSREYFDSHDGNIGLNSFGQLVIFDD